jgi:hypothetical protein
MPKPILLQKLSAQFLRYQFSVQDFTEAKAYLEALDTKQTREVKSALLLAAIVAYARPFTQNDPSAQIRATSTVGLNPKAELSQEQLALHDTVLEFRHKAIAHSSYDMRPFDYRATSETGYSFGGFFFDILAERLNVEVYKSACEVLAAVCRSRSAEINSQVFHAQGAA